MKASSRLIRIDDILFRVREPEGEGPFPVYLMLHGLTGNENSMWVFATRLPAAAVLIAPRGIYSSPLGGYSWTSDQGQTWPKQTDLSAAVNKLIPLLNLENFPQGEFSKINMIGFSQGAALSLSILVEFPNRVDQVASLSGFLPMGAILSNGERILAGKRIFLAHGTKDTQVPVKMAREAVEVLTTAGAKVTYCEDEVGHKLSASCFQGLEAFFRSESNG